MYERVGYWKRTGKKTQKTCRDGSPTTTSPLVDRSLVIDSGVCPTSTTQGSGSDIRTVGKSAGKSGNSVRRRE